MRVVSFWMLACVLVAFSHVTSALQIGLGLGGKGKSRKQRKREKRAARARRKGKTKKKMEKSFQRGRSWQDPDIFDFDYDSTRGQDDTFVLDHDSFSITDKKKLYTDREALQQERGLLSAQGRNVLGWIAPEQDTNIGEVVRGSDANNPSPYLMAINEIVQRSVDRQIGAVVLLDFYNILGGFSNGSHQRVQYLADVLCREYRVCVPRSLTDPTTARLNALKRLSDAHGGSTQNVFAVEDVLGPLEEQPKGRKFKTKTQERRALSRGEFFVDDEEDDSIMFDRAWDGYENIEKIEFEKSEPQPEEFVTQRVPYNRCLFVTAVYERSVKDMLTLYSALPDTWRSQFFTFLLKREKPDNDDFYLNLPAMHDVQACGVPVVPKVQVAPIRGDQYRDWQTPAGYTDKARKFWRREFPGRPFPNSVPRRPYSSLAAPTGMSSLARNAMGMLRFLRK